MRAPRFESGRRLGPSPREERLPVALHADDEPTAARPYGLIPLMPGIGLPLGSVNAGVASGATSISSPRARRTVAVPYMATRRHGRSFSTAMSAATKAVHAMLITPRANSDAISAQQHPTHQ